MNNEDVSHDSWRDHASEYERGFIDGMQRQAQSSVDKAVNAMSAAPVQVSPLEFVTMVMEKEHLVGKPLFWAEWPNKEQA